MNKEILQVCCAIIEYDGKVLVAQREEKGLLPLKWEFPGGKIEIGESAEECIKREIKEELDVGFEITSQLTSVIYHYDSFSLCLTPFIGKVSSSKYKRNNHAAIHWVAPEKLPHYDWAAADIPIVEEYLARIKKVTDQ